MWIKDYSKIARPLQDLVKKDVPFDFNDECRQAMDILKQAVANAPCLRPIDYKSERTVIFSVDSSVIAVGYILSQLGEDGRRYPSRYGSITWNPVESRYSQAKLELYGLYRALRAARLHIFGVQDLEVEVDAKYIKGMLNKPDIQPNASINRWIAGILLFNPRIVHVPADKHTGADGLSRRHEYPGDLKETDDHEAWLDRALSLHIGLVNRDYPMYRPNMHSFYYDSYANEPMNQLCTMPSCESYANILTEDSDSETPRGDEPVFPMRSDHAKSRDAELTLFKHYLETLERPTELSGSKLASFLRRASQYFIFNDKLMKRSVEGKHTIVLLDYHKRFSVITQAHDDLGHKGLYPTHARVKDRFWWPNLEEDIKWFVETCHECQTRQTTRLRIPPTVAPIPTLFQKVHMDIMLMPRVKNLRYIIQARCALTSYPEWRALAKESAAAIGRFIFEEILCRWGYVAEIVTDNGSAFIKALDWLADKYGIRHIRISGYNSQANGLVERKHFDVRESIMKMIQNDPSLWPTIVHCVFWAERVTIKRSTGMSPYYMVHGVEPIMPFDLTEATYLVAPMQPWMTTEDLIMIRARQLLKRPEDLAEMAKRLKKARIQSAQEFEKKYQNTIKSLEFPPGSLVLVRNTRVEKELNRKTKPRYLGPMVVIHRYPGGSYALAELDGSVSSMRTAQFRVIPYHPRYRWRYNIAHVVAEAAERLTHLNNMSDPDDLDMNDIDE